MTESREQLVGQIQRPGQRPENVTFISKKRPILTEGEKAAGLEWVDGRYGAGDVRRYGAKIDGSTDDTEAFKNAILANDGGIVTIEGGTLVSKEQPLDGVTSGIEICGRGKNVTKLVLAESTGATQMFGDTGAEVTDIIIRDLTVDCNDAVHGSGGTAPNTSVTGIRLGDNNNGGDASNRIAVRNVRVLDATEHGITVSRCNDFEITGCSVEGIDGGFGILSFRGGTNGRITNNYVRSTISASTCIILDDRSTASTTSEPHTDCVISNNVLDCNGQFSTGINAPAGSGIVVANNVILDPDVAGINIDENESGSVPETALEYTTVIGNTIRGQSNTGANSAAILCVGSHINIIGNNINDTAASGVLLWDDAISGVVPTNVNITGNTFENCAGSNGSTIQITDGTHINIATNTMMNNDRYGIRVLPATAVDGVNIVGNIIDGTVEHAVEVRSDAGNLSNVSIRANQISRTDTGSSSTVAGINVQKGTGTVDDIVISDNDIFDEAGVTFGIRLASAGMTNLRISMNRCSGVTTEFTSSATNADIVFRWGNSFDPRIVYGAAAPTGGTWSQGDIVYDTTPSAAGTIGWVCTTGGTPGTWKTFGSIAA